jgi:hypothetical protein
VFSEKRCTGLVRRIAKAEEVAELGQARKHRRVVRGCPKVVEAEVKESPPCGAVSTGISSHSLPQKFLQRSRPVVVELSAE